MRVPQRVFVSLATSIGTVPVSIVGVLSFAAIIAYYGTFA